VSGRSHSSAFGICAAIQRACATGENTSSSPCHNSTGTRISDRSNPHGEQKASASSIQPAAECRSASAKFFASSARIPVSATTRRSASGISGESVATWLIGSALILAAVCASSSISDSGSAAAVVNSRTLDSAIPANQSSPSASSGAIETSTPARVTCSGSIAAHASACGPPPDRPITANRFISRWFAIAATSAATSDTSLDTMRSEPP
jgi:hypothetical protein